MDVTSTSSQSEKMPLVLVRTWDWFTRPSTTLTDIGEQRAARLASSLTLTIFALSVIDSLASTLRIGLDQSLPRLIFTVISSLTAYFLTRTHWYRAGIFVFTINLCATGFISVITGSNTGEPGTVILIYVSLGLIVASAFLSAWAIFLVVGLNIAAFFSLPLFEIPYPDNTGAVTGIITAIGLILILINNFRSGIEKDRLAESQKINQELEKLSRELESRVQQRTAELEESNQKAQRRANQLQAVNNIARAISTIQDLDKLLPTITQAISRGFDVYHAGIFLLDKRGEYAELRAANSEGGQRMLARQHRLRVGEEGIIGYVTKYGRARIALDVGEDAVFFNNPDLPETRSEIGLPLIVSGNVIGALDVQSTQPNAFGPEDINALAALANQVSIAIQNADLFSQVQQSATEMERAYRQFIRQEWEKITASMENLGYIFTSRGVNPLVNMPAGTKEPGIVSVPVTLRGEVIGEIGMRTRENDGKINPDEMTILRATADRVALALENARLFRDAQLRAATERAISEMSAKIAASVDVDSILQSTVQELGQLVGDSEVLIQLGNKTTNS